MKCKNWTGRLAYPYYRCMYRTAGSQTVKFIKTKAKIKMNRHRASRTKNKMTKNKLFRRYRSDYEELDCRALKQSFGIRELLYHCAMPFAIIYGMNHAHTQKYKHNWYSQTFNQSSRRKIVYLFFIDIKCVRTIN